ncbi:hypothetical protein RSOLAG22IIIB_09211 [Rhizoctonia solani]|uniref:Uncharacterized protein n=1 Tax=Rhizoctonia solani TaxID=456999 RepID=A0A0K6FY88_9AGAM|nr:hypothetical protein RSOLAG22IIIB_09211 [Rhizoctonia solani]
MLFHFNSPVTKIIVRREVSALPNFLNAYSGGGVSAGTTLCVDSRFSDGLGQDLGSLKREIGKVRPSSGSGKRRVRFPKPNSPTVEAILGTKLEFEDDDALFKTDEDLPNGIGCRWRSSVVARGRHVSFCRVGIWLDVFDFADMMAGDWLGDGDIVLARKSISRPTRRIVGLIFSLSGLWMKRGGAESGRRKRCFDGGEI